MSLRTVLSPNRSGVYRSPALCRVVGISYRQLDYWARTGLLLPSVSPAIGSGSQRLYSQTDVVLSLAIRKLLYLGVSLQRVRGLMEPGEPGDPLGLREAVRLRRKRWSATVSIGDRREAGTWLELAPLWKKVEEAEGSDDIRLPSPAA